MKLNLRSVDLNLLPVFVAVVEEGQLSRASVRLGMSQPAVSAALQRLRLTLDDPLFIRSRSGLTPTPRARALYQQFTQGLQLLAEALDPTQAFDPATSERTFRLLAVDYFEFLLVGPLVERLRQLGPGLRVEVMPQTESWVSRVQDALVDFALDTQLPEDERLGSAAVSSEQLSVVARREHGQIQGQLSLEMFLAAQHVVLPLRDRRVLPLDQILGKPGWRRNIVAQVSQYQSMLAVVSSSELVATVPKRLAESMAAAFRLQVLPFPVPVPEVPVYLIWPKALEKDPAHQWFRHQLEQQMQAL